MVAATDDFLHSPAPLAADEHGFVGDWLLDRVSGLVDSATAVIQHLRVDATALHIHLKAEPHGAAVTLTAELNGQSAQLALGERVYAAQALLESDVLVWEFERQRAQACERVRRVMHVSAQRSQLVAERVDLNAEGVPVALRTEYWTRAGRHADDAAARPR